MDNHLLLVDSLRDVLIGSLGIGAAAGTIGINKGGGFGIPNTLPNSSFPRRSVGPQCYITVFKGFKKRKTYSHDKAHFISDRHSLLNLIITRESSLETRLVML